MAAHRAEHTSFTDFGRWTPSWLGLATNHRLEKYLARLTPAKHFEDLVTPLAIAATDINAGITIYYTRGPIVPPLRGSCAYPGLFVPIQFEDRMLVDGFLTSPVPVEGALLLGMDIVIAVYLEAANMELPAHSPTSSAGRFPLFNVTRIWRGDSKLTWSSSRI